MSGSCKAHQTQRTPFGIEASPRAVRATLALLVLLGAAVASAQTSTAPTGDGVTIAVLDTGIDSSHAEVAGRVTRESYATPGVPVLPLGTVLPEDPDGQGTAVASLAAGATLGVASGARLLDLQVSAKYTGQPVVDPATEAAAIEALDQLLQTPRRAPIVLLSFAQDGLSADGAQTLAAQANGLWEQGVLVIAPAGPSPNALTAASHVLTVAGREGCPNLQSTVLKPDLVAASQDLQAAQATTLAVPGGTTQVSGTAYAAAQVAGAAALLLETRPDLPVDALAAFLRDAATDLGEPGPDACTGFGDLDADTALAWLATWHDPLAMERSQSTPPVGLGFILAGIGIAAVVRRRE